MGAINLGSQTITWKYETALSGLSLSSLLARLLHPMVLSGLSPSVYSTTQVGLTLGNLLIGEQSTPESNCVKVNFGAAFQVTVTSAHPYVVARWIWVAAAANYVDIIGVATPLITDVILCSCSYTGANLTGVSSDPARNLGIGFNALLLNIIGIGNTAVGPNALDVATGDYNTGVGYNALGDLTTGHKNTAIGNNAGKDATKGLTSTHSTFIGADSLPSANGVDHETVIGSDTVGSGANTVTLGRAADTAWFGDGTALRKLSSTLVVSTIPLRDSSGRIKAADPADAQDVVTKLYLEASLDNILKSIAFVFGLSGFYKTISDVSGDLPTTSSSGIRYEIFAASGILTIVQTLSTQQFSFKDIYFSTLGISGRFTVPKFKKVSISKRGSFDKSYLPPTTGTLTTPPTVGSRSSDFSPDYNYLAVGTDGTTGHLKLYKRVSAGNYTLAASYTVRNISIMHLKWAPDGIYLLVSNSPGSGLATVNVYKRVGDTLEVCTVPVSAAAATNGSAWSSDSLHLVTTSSTTGGGPLRIWKRTADKTFTLIYTYAGTNTTFYGVAYSDSGDQLIGCGSTDCLTMFARSGDTYTPTISVLTQSLYYVVPDPHHTDVFFWYYNSGIVKITRSGGDYTYNADCSSDFEDDATLTSVIILRISADGNYAIMARSVTPFLIYYKWESGIFVRVDPPVTNPGAAVEDCSLSANGDSIFADMLLTPYFYIYRRNLEIVAELWDVDYVGGSSDAEVGAMLS